MNPSRNNLIWIDLEMTGLNPDQDRIIEMAAVITNPQLEVLAESPVFVIHQSESVLKAMDDWNTKQHSKSGLIERVKNSTVTNEEAQAEMIEFLMHYTPPGKSPMCGSSICQDRRFLYRWMPKLEQYFHYRNLDVSSIKILAYHWAAEIIPTARRESQHLALQDIHDSIDELRYYKENFFRDFSKKDDILT
jgi:oligoribonuclease